MSDNLHIPITGGFGNRSNYGTLIRDSNGVLRNSDGSVWSPLSVEQVAISWKLYIAFLFGLLLFWQGYEWSFHLLDGRPNEKETPPDIPLEGKASFMVDTELYQDLSLMVYTTTTVTNVAILSNEDPDTKFVHINSTIFAGEFHDNYINFKVTKEENRYILTLNANASDSPVTNNIQILLPSRRLNLDGLSIVLPTGRVDSSALVNSHINNLNVKVDNGTITFENIRGTNINLKTSIGDITGTFSITHTYSAMSDQGNIDCRLRVPSHSTPDISIGTFIGNATARVTDTFRGSFSLFTKRGRAYVFGDRYMDYSTNTTSAKNGYFRGDNRNSSISMYAQKGRITLAFKRQV